MVGAVGTVSQVICSIHRATSTCHDCGTSTGAAVKRATRSSGSTRARRSAKAAGVGLSNAANGETAFGYRRALPCESAKDSCCAVSANQIGLSRTSVKNVFGRQAQCHGKMRASCSSYDPDHAPLDSIFCGVALLPATQPRAIRRESCDEFRLALAQVAWGRGTCLAVGSEAAD